MPPPRAWKSRAVPRAKAASEAVPRAKKMRKKRKLDESEEGARAESASCAEAVVRDLDACEIHVVTFSAPEWHFDAAEAAMLLILRRGILRTINTICALARITNECI